MATKKYVPLEIPSEDTLRVEEDDTPDKNEAQFYLFIDGLPEEYKLKYGSTLKQMKKAYNFIRILLTGKTGSGKSTLVNGILGVKLPEQAIAKEGKTIDECCTTKVTDYHITKGNVKMTVWDSPGLQDSTDSKRYLQQMKEKCSERNLTLYCIDVRQARFISGDDNPDVVAMTKLTTEFDPQFWNNTIIVLTCFNCVADDVNIRYLKTKEKTEAIKDKLQEWKDQIVKILIDNVKIDRTVAEKIPIVPAGHYREPHLPVCKYWLSNLWLQCFAAIPTREGQLALLKASFSRIKNEDDVEENDFDNIENQPIVNPMRTIMEFFKMLWKMINDKVSRMKTAKEKDFENTAEND